MDEDIGRDDSLGDVTIDLDNPEYENGITSEEFNLSQTGSILISLKYIDSIGRDTNTSESRIQSVQRTVFPPGKDEVSYRKYSSDC